MIRLSLSLASDKSNLEQKLHLEETEAENVRQTLQAKLCEMESEKDKIQRKYVDFLRKVQEDSFRQMESARWLPAEEEETKRNLDRLKANMRRWAREISIKDLSLLLSLERTEYDALVKDLTQVVLLENNQLPPVLFTAARSPMLLLNALLAQYVYSSLFQSPFCVYEEGGRLALESIYQPAQSGKMALTYNSVLLIVLANQRDAERWRSDTMRLLMPPLRDDNSEAEKCLRSKTEDLIAQVADQKALAFLASPAHHLINTDMRSRLTPKLQKIFSDAASLSYMLWTQRGSMRCRTLRDLTPLTFEGESAQFSADVLVKYDGNEERLAGREVTVVVHPLLEVCGSADAEDYDKWRVRAEAVVWFDNR
ncbi:hypothetical protein OIDMADRAFT_138389 [Oidiodendron maius Zn]|uniref:Uncharacterized protein n=1 Tax=Oidiodendron maius (strain Zn) TaxID=913774 RepID=A0A0C3GAE3_OIDMZ|nr:hypothetical protein OIDMADRAFT_138389 [Oidiodendron maius Zn]